MLNQMELLNIADLAVKLVFALMAAGVYWVMRKYVYTKIDKEQMKQIIFWVESFVMWAENTFKGQKLGPLKEDKVLQSLKGMGITLPDDMLRSLIKIIVDNFNNTDWKKRLFDIDGNTTEKEVIVNVGSNSESGTAEQV